MGLARLPLTGEEPQARPEARGPRLRGRGMVTPTGLEPVFSP